MLGTVLDNGPVWYSRHLALEGRREGGKVVSWFDTKVHKTVRRKEMLFGGNSVGTSEIKCLSECLVNNPSE